MEPIYERHAGLFERESVERGRRAEMRGRPPVRSVGDDEEEARLRYLHQFALDGHLGAITREPGGQARPISRHRSRSRWAARRSRTGWRRWSRRTSRTPNAGPRSRRRATRCSPSGSIRCIWRGSRGPTPACTALGWPSYLDAYSDVRALDLRALAAAAGRLRRRPRRPATPASSIRSWRERSGVRLGELRRSDLARFFRASHLDVALPGRSDGPGPPRHAGRAGHRPGRAVERHAGHRGAADEEPARLLLDAAGARARSTW